ncbi:MAG: DUF547 domain-containing protein [Pseudobdellovibrionaceae bacterium]|nr:MAG: DUF547 domain-containing protein [Pseudobdellovibrionaceae bacterium]
MRQIRSTVLFFALLLALGFLYVLVPELQSPAVAEAASPTFDHSHKALTSILHQHVVMTETSSSVMYKRLKLKKSELEQYLKTLGAVTPGEYEKWTKNEQMAFLINAYNGFTLKLIVDHYPVKSIKDIGSWFSKPWKKNFFELLGEKRNLDWIEHTTLREKFKEPRIHFAVNCASIGCPRLLNEAFVATELDEQLDRQATAFLRDTSRNAAHDNDKTLQLSKIFDWFEGDFTRGGRTVAQFVAPYMTDDKTRQGQLAQFSVKFLSYDWSLNDVQ